MTDLIDAIFSSSTAISLLSALISGVVAWTSMKGKVERLGEKVQKIDDLNLDVRLTEMQKDIQYMRERFDEYTRSKK